MIPKLKIKPLLTIFIFPLADILAKFMNMSDKIKLLNLVEICMFKF